MKNIAAVLLLLFLVSGAAAAQDSQVERQVTLAERTWETALLKVDTQTLGKIYSDDLSYTHSSGSTDTKAEYIANLKAGKLKYTSVARENARIRAYGNTAIYTCKATMTVVANGQTNTFVVTMLHVWIKEHGSWRMVVHQTTRLP